MLKLGKINISLGHYSSLSKMLLVSLVVLIFRKPKECKERHKILMDRTAGDGADSAEDSGSSQPYPSTLPGIPKVRILIFPF